MEGYMPHNDALHTSVCQATSRAGRTGHNGAKALKKT